jgi:hydroxymethylpyrimidine/phosphomethylpyrimidine kinase
MKKEDVVVTITAYDPSCGAGIGQDIKILSSIGLNGCGIITGIISQTKSSVKSIKFLSGDEVRTQFHTIFEEFIPLSLKIGIAGTREILQSIKESLTSFRYNKYIVIDPVTKSTSGHSLSKVDIKEVIYTFIDLSIIITPNKEELSMIMNKELDDPYEALSEIYKELNKPILLTGLKSEEYIKDILIYNNEFYEFSSPMVEAEFHDKGGALTSAICGFLSKGYNIVDSISYAKSYFDKLLSHSFQNRWLLNVGLNEYLDSKINETRDDLNEFAIDFCSFEGVNELIPESGINTGILASDYIGFEAIAVFDRNITIDRRLGITGPPQSIIDNSCHLSDILLTCHRRWKDIKAIINIKLDDKILNATKKTGLSMSELEYQNEMQHDLIKETKSIEHAIENINTDEPPDVIYYTVYQEKEPMIFIIASDIDSLFDKILLILNEIRSNL